MKFFVIQNQEGKFYKKKAHSNIWVKSTNDATLYKVLGVAVNIVYWKTRKSDNNIKIIEVLRVPPKKVKTVELKNLLKKACEKDIADFERSKERIVDREDPYISRLQTEIDLLKEKLKTYES